MRGAILFAALGCVSLASAQEAGDTIINVLQLGDVVVHGRTPGMRYEGFIRQVMDDTTFQHAFLNTRFYAHYLKSELHVRDKKGQDSGYMLREGHLLRTGPTVELILESARESGKLRDKDGDFRFLTAEMYDDVFILKGPHRASNAIASRNQEISRESRFDKYKSELKKFMFNPGQEIASVPFIGDKLALFEPSMVPLYDFSIGTEFRNGHPCWVFSALARDTVGGKLADEDDTVIKRMKTWFDQETMNVMAREYRIMHASLILDFDISIRVENRLTAGELVPTQVWYDGVWDIPFKKKEIVNFYLLYSDWKVVQ